MPTFPWPSLKFRTAGFPQYGFKAGMSDRACPFDAACTSLGLPPSFVFPAAPIRSPFCAGGMVRAEAPPFEQPLLLYPRGPRSEVGSAVPLHLHLSGPIRPTRRHIRISPLRGLYQMPSLCTLRLGDLRAVPRFRCPSFLTCRPQRPRGDRNRLVPDMRFRLGLRHVMSGSALPTVLQSASRRADISGLPGSLLLRPVKLLAPCANLTRISSGHRDFYLQASDESVTLLAAGYNYDIHWTVLSQGLSPFGMTASVAAP